jgi:DNA replication ATP-dependent helicase Dna2
VQPKLAPPRISSQLPSSSSPYPDAGDRHVGSSGSPLQRRVQQQGEANLETMQVEDELDEQDMHMDQPEQDRSSDDFGDDDFDDMVDVLVDSPQVVDVAVPGTSHGTIPTEPIQPQIQQQPQPQDGDSDDEFGMDEDEDGFAADLEQVASLYDTRPLLTPSQQAVGIVENSRSNTARKVSAVTTPVIDLVDADDDDDDEFGDEIDADVFAAAEVAATQTSANTVRRTSTFP